MSYEDCIDVVKEWVLSLGYATQAWVQARGYLTAGYIHNPCTLDWDYKLADFTRDGNWHDLDISAIVPAGIKAVHLHFRIKSNGVGHYLLLLKPGEGSYGCNTYTYTQVANARLGVCLIATPDTDRIIQYRLSNVPWAEVNCKIMGWWF